MKNTLLLFLFCITVGILPGSGQDKTNNGIPDDLLLQNKEEVFINYNSSFLLAGETLYYKFYSLDPETGKSQTISKIGYIELTGEDGKRIFLQKVALEKGNGYGDFLIPSTVPSGTYKLTGYTKWMLNAGLDHYFEGDVVIINPYLEDQSNIQLAEEAPQDNMSLGKDPIKNNTVINNNLYSLGTNANNYGKREEVVIEIAKLNAGIAKGNFSLSVKKLEEYETPKSSTASNFKDQYQGENWVANSNVILPDLRGEVVSGKIIEKGSTKGVGGRSLVYSIPGKSFFIRITKTSPDGSFLFNRDSRNYGSTAYLQVLGGDSENFDIILDEVQSTEKKDLEFIKFRVTPSMADLIRQRSIYNQVENSYAAVKQDSILPGENSLPFYGTLPELYNLDDFTRFPTLRETFIEIIQMSRIRRNRDGTSRFELISKGDLGIEPLLIVDGIIVQNHEDLVHYDARKIKSIGLQRDEYYLGPESFKGLIVFETVNGDFVSSLNRPYIHTADVQNVQPEKEYFHPQYESEKNSRIPDYRLQLLWQPVVKIEGSSREIRFFTSDVPGNYEIRLEGFTDNGEAVSLRKVISVQ